MDKVVIGVMGPGKASEKDMQNAFRIGELIAKEGWVLLSGGMNKGVMDEVNKGAKSAHGLTIGIISTKNKLDASSFVDVSIVTGMGSGRNYINVLSSDLIIACGMGAGTASEVAMAIKEDKPVILLTENHQGNLFFQNLNPKLVSIVNSPEEIIAKIKEILNR